MMVMGISVIDTDSLDAAADLLDDTEEVEIRTVCTECGGAREITDYSPSHGYINVECPCCEGWGTVVDWEAMESLAAEDDDPEPPTPAAPALAVIIPLFQCETCRDTGRVIKPSNWFAGKTIEGFCPDCTPHFDFAARQFVNCGRALAGEATPPAAPFDRAAHCRRIGQTGGLTTYQRCGRHHMAAIGTAGAKVTIERHGHAYWLGLVTAKGYTARRDPDVLADLTAARELVELKRAA